MDEHMTTLFGLIAQLDKNDAKSVRVALNGRFKVLADIDRKSWFVGDRVYFMHKGARIEGNIIKIMRKNIKVKTDVGSYSTWTVYPSFLIKVVE